MHISEGDEILGLPFHCALLILTMKSFKVQRYIDFFKENKLLVIMLPSGENWIATFLGSPTGWGTDESFPSVYENNMIIWQSIHDYYISCLLNCKFILL